MPRTRHGDGIAGAALTGALAGMLGGMAMKAVMEMEQRALLPGGERMEPPPRAVVEKIEAARGMDLSPEEERTAAMAVHLGYSALWGAVHGVGQDLMDLPPALHGLLLGGLVYATTMGPSGLLTRLGVTPSPMIQPLSAAAIPVGAHVAYGLATAAAYEALN